MKTRHRFIFALLLFYFQNELYCHQQSLPRASSLRKINYIEEAQNVEITYFPQYHESSFLFSPFNSIEPLSSFNIPKSIDSSHYLFADKAYVVKINHGYTEVNSKIGKIQ